MSERELKQAQMCNGCVFADQFGRPIEQGQNACPLPSALARKNAVAFNHCNSAYPIGEKPGQRFSREFGLDQNRWVWFNEWREEHKPMGVRRNPWPTIID